MKIEHEEHCHIHTDVALVKYCPACRGIVGGSVTSEAKTAANREKGKFGKLGGRPTLPEHSARCRQLRKKIRKYADISEADAMLAGGWDPKCRGCQARAPKPPKHAANCDVVTTGRYTKDCPGCQFEARKFSAIDRMTLKKA